MPSAPRTCQETPAYRRLSDAAGVAPAVAGREGKKAAAGYVPREGVNLTGTHAQWKRAARTERLRRLMEHADRRCDRREGAGMQLEVAGRGGWASRSCSRTAASQTNFRGIRGIAGNSHGVNRGGTAREGSRLGTP